MNLGPDPIPRPISRSASASASATPTQNQNQTKPRSRSRSQTPAPAAGAGAGNLSRSASRASGISASGTSNTNTNTNTTTLSRNASLIKKNIELQDLRPADVLIERFVAWKAIVKQLTAWFEGIADIENNTAKELSKLAGVIQVPFRAGNQFLGEGGLQDVYYDLRNKTRMIADTHADLGRTIDSSIVQHLQKLRAEIKAHIKNVQNDTGKLAAGVAKERELSTKLVGELANSISTFKNTPMNVHAKNDPYIANLSVTRQLTRQVHEENLLHKSLIMTQQSSAHFELGIIKSLQSAYASFDEWNARSSTTTSLLFSHIARGMRDLPVDKEWIQFAARSESLLDPETPLRDVERIRYPLMDEACVRALHKGHMERKKRFTRAWRESYFVLTPAGFLHEYETADEDTGPGGGAGAGGGGGGGGGVRGKAKGQTPVFSLFLPSCTLGPASSPRGGSHKFHIEGRKDGLGTTKSGSFKGLLSGEGSGGESNKAWSFRCKSREEMMEWWNDIRMLCARYLVASESVDRTGPVEEAVRSVGYVSEDWEEEDEEGEGELEEDEDEEGAVVDQTGLGHPLPPPISRIGALSAGADDDGSSVAEEEDHEHEDHPPVYSHPHPGGMTAVEKHYNNYTGMGVGGGGIEIGPNGYAIEKKSPAPAPASFPTQGPVGGGGGGEREDHIINYRSAPTTFLSPTLVRNGSNQDVKSQRAVIGGVAGGDLNENDNEDVDEGVDDDDAQGGGEQGGERVGRRLSKRQMEKAPEGVGRATPPPPIQLRDTGVVPPSSTQPTTQPPQQQTQTQSSRPGSASRYRSPPPSAPRTHDDDDHDDGEDEDEEGMYVSERDAEGEVSRPHPEHEGEHEAEHEGEGEEGADAPTVSTPQEETSPSSKSKKKKLRKGKKSGAGAASSAPSAPTTPGADADAGGDTDAKIVGGTTKAVQGVGAAIGSALKGNGGGGGGGGGGALDGDVD